MIKQEHFESILTSGNLLELKIFQVNRSYFEIPDPLHWIIDAGIQLVFSQGMITFGWDQDLEMFRLNNIPFREIYDETNYKTLTQGRLKELQRLFGKRIVRTQWKWAPIEILNMETSEFEKSETLLELILEFHTGETLQIATLDYDLSAEDDPEHYRLKVDSELLISFNHIFELI